MKKVTRGSRAIRSTSEEKVEVKTVVAGVTYTEEKIDYISATRLLFAGEKPAIGGCVAAQLDLDLWTEGQVIPRKAKIQPYVRVIGGDEAAGKWIPKGVFWTDTRELNDEKVFIALHAFDALLYAEDRFLADGDTGSWPRTMVAVANQICTRIGVGMDPRTLLNSVYTIDYPNDYTMRELLGFIGAANGGNWIITDEGKLRLIRLGDVPEETYFLITEDGSPIRVGEKLIFGEIPPDPAVPGHSTGTTGKIFVGRDINDFHVAPAFDPISRVTLWIDDDTFVTAGDDSGYLIEADCPWATQTMANNVLEQLRGYIYRPYEATDASLPPAAELGDGVTADGVYSVIASIKTDFNALYTADIAAPADQEIDHEIPYESKTQRELARKVALGKNYYGTRIDRLHGLQIVKVNQDGSESSRAQLNSDVLAFYDEDDQPMLYFDPVNAKYVFEGLLRATKILAGAVDGVYAQLSEEGFNLYDDQQLNKIALGLEDKGSYATPFLILGAGTSSSASDAGLVEKFGRGIWIGSSEARGSVDKPVSGSGIWVDFVSKQICAIVNGQETDILAELSSLDSNISDLKRRVAALEAQASQNGGT